MINRDSMPTMESKWHTKAYALFVPIGLFIKKNYLKQQERVWQLGKKHPK
jgi:hypothetical protein